MTTRLLRLLHEPGAVLDREGDAWIVRIGADRRRKPAMRLSEAQMLTALDGQNLTRRAGGEWGLMKADDPAPVFRRAARMSPLSHLMRSGFIAKRHVASLEAFTRDQAVSYAQPGLTSNWDGYGTVSGGGRTGTDDAQAWRLKARERSNRALGALGALRGVFEAVCLNELALADAERQFRLARGEGRMRVRDALERLAVFYGV